MFYYFKSLSMSVKAVLLYKTKSLILFYKLKYLVIVAFLKVKRCKR